MGVYGWSKQLACDSTQSGRVILHALHKWQPGSVGLSTLITQHQVWYATQTHCPMSDK